MSQLRIFPTWFLLALISWALYLSCALCLVPCALFLVPSTKSMSLKYLLYSRQLALSIHPFHYHADSFADIIIEKSEHHLSIGLVG